MKPPSKTDLLASVSRFQHENTIQALALADLIADRVIWRRRGHVMLGICRPLSPCGGIVIQRDRDDKTGLYAFVGAYYWETWYVQINGTDWSHQDTAGQALRDCANDCAMDVRKAQRAAWEPAAVAVAVAS